MSRPDSTRHVRALACLAVLAALVFPAPSFGAEKGLETDMTWGTGSRTQQRTATGVSDLGAGWVRLTLVWHDVETSPGTYDSSQLGMYDNAIAAARSSGAKVLVTIYGAPSWASGRTEREAPPQDPADYARFAKAMAARYSGQVDAWEVWNEENFNRFWPSGPNASQYVQLLKAAYPAIKSADASVPVLFGGLATNDYAYLEAAYAAAPDIGAYFDAMATHPYTFPASPPEEGWTDANGRIAKNSFPGYRELRSTMLAHGDDKPIWFTEFGWSTNTTYAGVSEAEQADYLTRAYRCLEQDPYVKVAIWFEYRNNYWASDANTWEDQLGLVRTDFSQKPAYNSFKAYQPGSGGCTYTGLSAPPVAPPTTSDPSSAQPSSDPIPLTSDPLALISDPRQTSTTGTSTETAAPTAEPAAPAPATGRITVRLRLRAAGRTVGVSGRVLGGGGGRAVLRLERRSGGRWLRAGSRKIVVAGSGAFSGSLSRLRAGSWRVCADWASPSGEHVRSRLIRFAV